MSPRRWPSSSCRLPPNPQNPDSGIGDLRAFQRIDGPEAPRRGFQAAHGDAETLLRRRNDLGDTERWPRSASDHGGDHCPGPLRHHLSVMPCRRLDQVALALTYAASILHRAIARRGVWQTLRAPLADGCIRQPYRCALAAPHGCTVCLSCRSGRSVTYLYRAHLAERYIRNIYLLDLSASETRSIYQSPIRAFSCRTGFLNSPSGGSIRQIFRNTLANTSCSALWPDMVRSKTRLHARADLSGTPPLRRTMPPHHV